MPNYRTDVFSLDEENGVEFAMQLNSGDVGVSADGSGFLHQADAAGQSITKSTVNAGFSPINDGGTIVIEMDFMVPLGAPVDQIFLADIESSNANTGTHPGVRIYLSEGMIRVDRAKIGLDTWYGQNDPIEAGEWHSQRIELVSGGEETGRLRIFIDDVLVLDAAGSTTLSQDIMDQYGWDLEGGQLDRVQVGLTANNGNSEASLATRNISVEVSDSSTGYDVGFELDPSRLINNAEQPIAVLPSEISYFDNSVPESAITNDLRDCAPPGVKSAGGTTTLGAKISNPAQKVGNDAIEGNQPASVSEGQGDDTPNEANRETSLLGDTTAKMFIFKDQADTQVVSGQKASLSAAIVEAELQSAQNIDFWQNGIVRDASMAWIQDDIQAETSIPDAAFLDTSTAEALEAFTLLSQAEMDFSF